MDEVNIGRVAALRMGCGNKVPGWTVMRNCASGMQALSLLDRITAPALVVRGGLSPVLSRALADRVVTTIRGARLVEIPGTYHHLVLDAPAAFVAVLADFLSTLR